MPPSSPPATGGDPWSAALDATASQLRQALGDLGASYPEDELREQLGEPGRSEADLAFAVHRLAKARRVDPVGLGAEIAAAIRPGPPIIGVTASRGFVNFTVDPAWLALGTVGRALGDGARYGSGPGSGRTVCVEHTSANPTGPFHMGRVRNGIIGDTMARVLRAAGESVTTQYYVDDVGRQSAMVTWIWSQPVDRWPPEIRATIGSDTGPDLTGARPDLALGRPYPAVSGYLKTHPDAAAEVQALAARLESGDAPKEHRTYTEAILRGMLGSLARVGIGFDEFVWESSFIADGSVEKVVERLGRAPHAATEANGARAIDGSGYGLPRENGRIIYARGDGTTLYVTRDIAYHLAKFRRFDRVTDVLGQDHLLHARTLDVLLEEIGESRRPEFLIYQDITVPEGGRMSTRKGSAVYLDDLLDEAVSRAEAEVRRRRPALSADETARIARSVAAGAVRYHILRVAPEKTVSFRWEDAMAFEGRSGPFLQYAHARASSILRKAEASEGPWPFDAGQLVDADSRALIRVLASMPRTVAYAARTGHVHTVAGYAHEVAEAFNHYYEHVPVLEGGEARASRVALVAATRRCLGFLLDLLGVDALESM